MTGSKRALAVFAAGALFTPLVSLSSPAFAAGEATPPAPRDITELCANVPDDYDPFTDIDGNTFEQNIKCLAFAEITQGLSGGNQYGPGFSVTRGQMASFIARMIDAADDLDTGDNVQELPAFDGADSFDDVADGYVHRANIDRLDEAGIVNGGPGGRPASQYGPELPVTRAQMASFIKRALEYMTGDNFDTALDFFTDDENAQPHEPNINGVAAEGIAVGDGNNTYNPFQNVSRGQMAGFLTRTLDVLFQDGDIEPIGGEDNPPPPPAPAQLESVTGSDADADGTLSAGDIITLTFDKDVYTESSVTLEDTDGDSVTLSDDGGMGDCAATFDDGDDGDQEGTDTVVVTVAEDCDSDLDGTLAVTAISGIFDEETGEEAELDENVDTSFELDPGEQQDGQVTLTSSNVQQGGTVTGSITGDVTSATLSGCGLNNEPVQDTDAGTAGIQFAEQIPNTQPTGDCTLTFTITQADGTTVTETETITVSQTPPTGGASTNTRPELISAAIVDTVTNAESAAGGGTAGTTVRYTFDEEITGTPALVPGAAIAANTFAVYDFTGTADRTGTIVSVSADGQSVVVRYTNIITDSAAAQLSVATVDFGTVRDNEQQNNPIGDAAIGTGRSTTLAAGATSAPDLVGVENFRNDQTTADRTLVDFRFDAPAFTNVVNSPGFYLVRPNNTELACTAVGGQPGGQPGAGQTADETITVSCTNGAAGNPTLTAADIARGYIDAGTVFTQPGGGGSTNPLQAVDVSNAGNTTGPDLESAEFFQNGGANDQVVFDFDELVIATSADATLFFIYDNQGRQISGDPGSATQGTTGDRVVITFSRAFGGGVAGPTGATTSATTFAVGASVEQSAVTSSTGTARTNNEDEVGVANTASNGLAAGRTDDPDLTGVSLATVAGATGNTTVATYTFDEDLNETNGTVDQTKLFLVQGDGTRLQCTQTLPNTPRRGGTEDTDNTVTCNQFRILTEGGGVGDVATAQQVLNAVLGTADNGAVFAEGGTLGPDSNPEGAEPTTGGTGSRQQ